MYQSKSLLSADVPDLRREIDHAVLNVSRSCRHGTRFLLLWMTQLYTGGRGTFPAELQWSTAISQAFTIAHSSAGKSIQVPGFQHAVNTWFEGREDSKPRRPPTRKRRRGDDSGTKEEKEEEVQPECKDSKEEEKPNELKEFEDGDLAYLTQAVIFESNAYYSTLLKNYSKVAITAHCKSTLVYACQGDKRKEDAVRQALSASASESAVAAALALLPAEVADVIRACRTVRDMEWKDAEAEAQLTEAVKAGKDNKASRVTQRTCGIRTDMAAKSCIEAAFGLRVQLQAIADNELERRLAAVPPGESKDQVKRPKQFALLPLAKTYRRFITVDTQVARGLLKRAGLDKPGATIADVLNVKHPRLAKFQRAGLCLGKTFKTNGHQVSFPLETRCDVEEVSTTSADGTEITRTCFVVRNGQRVRALDAHPDIPSRHGFMESSAGLFSLLAVQVTDQSFS
jgi:hypothetical protein